VSPEEIKRALAPHAEDLARHLFPHGKREGSHWCVGSIAGEPGQSFKICIAGEKIGLWGDFDGSEPHSQSPIDLWMKARNVDFKTALRQAADWLGISLIGSIGPTQTRNGGHQRSSSVAGRTAYVMSLVECQLAVRMAVSLRGDARLCDRVAKARGWKPETVRQLTYDPCLGWHEGKLAFLYDSGVKLRWRENEQRRFAFAFGKAHTLWRASLIVSTTRTVIVTEGETDGISAIDAGVEDANQETIVVALPGASIMRVEWGPLFKGREVILCFDSDDAGRSAVRKFASIVAPYATAIRKPSWKGRLIT